MNRKSARAVLLSVILIVYLYALLLLSGGYTTMRGKIILLIFLLPVFVLIMFYIRGSAWTKSYSLYLTSATIAILAYGVIRDADQDLGFIFLFIAGIPLVVGIVDTHKQIVWKRNRHV